MYAGKTNNKELLGKLVIIYDKQDNVLRIDGRVRSENLTKDEQFPIVLSKDSRIASMLMRQAHTKTGHGGNQLVLQYLRAKFWIIVARRVVKNIRDRVTESEEAERKSEEAGQQVTNAGRAAVQRENIIQLIASFKAES